MTQAKQNVVYIESSREINHETGEIKRESISQAVRVGKEPPYIKMYIGSICMLRGVPKGAQDTLLAVLRKLDYEGYITLSKRYRLQCCEELGIKEQSFRNNLSNLCKKGILKNVGRNDYMADPNLFARGEWKDIVEQRANFTMTVNFENGKEPVIETEKVQYTQQNLAL